MALTKFRTPPKGSSPAGVERAFQQLLINNNNSPSNESPGIKATPYTIQTKTFYKSPVARALFPPKMVSRTPSPKKVNHKDSKKRKAPAVKGSSSKKRKAENSWSISGGVSHAIKKPKATNPTKRINKPVENVVENMCQETPVEDTPTEKSQLEASPKIEEKSPNATPDVTPKTLAKNKMDKPGGRSLKVGRDSRMMFINGVMTFKKESSPSPKKQKLAERRHASPVLSSVVSFEVPTESKVESEQMIIDSKVHSILSRLEADWSDGKSEDKGSPTMEATTSAAATLEVKILPQAVLEGKATEACEMEQAPPTQAELDTLNSTEGPSKVPEDEELKLHFTSDDDSMPANSGDTSVMKKASSPEEKKYYPLFYKSSKRTITSSSPSTPSKPRKKRRLGLVRDEPGYEQLLIDAGQKRFGSTLCKVCGILYNIGEAEDELMHQRHHQKYASNIQHKGWMNERVVGEYTEGRVIMIKPDDPKHWLERVKVVLELVDEQLGVETSSKFTSHSKAFMYIANKAIVGFLLCEGVHVGYRMEPKAVGDEKNALPVCGKVSHPIKCGISRIWTAPSHRKKYIASALVDCMRAQFVYGEILNMDQFAFSTPTIDGMQFAEKYAKTPSYLVYNSYEPYNQFKKI